MLRPRVVDSSVMPALVSGNTTAPAMALAWRPSDLILQEQGMDRCKNQRNEVRERQK